ncbi:MAG: hypothetical protein HZC41_01860 [Chloroflexi bacterium]|nr:hypothetical protein [Chloroflexota bacterium]
MPKSNLFFLFLLCLVLAAPAAAQDPSKDVIATHYPVFGGVDPAPRDAVTASYTVYNNRENDYRAVTEEEAKQFIAQVEQETGLTPRLLNHWSDVQEGTDTLQIVNNVPVQGALYTLILPPGWTRTAKMPVLLSGNGAGTSNNSRLYGDPETIMPRLIASSVNAGGRGIIGAVSNAGGTESQGIDEKTYRSVGAFLDFMDKNGGDKHNVVTAGGSRGGGTALMWAINPLGLDYTVKAVFAEVPPTHYGTLSQVSPITFPSMNSIGVLVSGDSNAWRFDNDGLHPGLNPSPFMEVLIGSGVPEEADARSPIGMAERLRGKKIVISEGAHDAFFPLSPFLEFDRRLTELDIPHATFVTLASGHEMHDFWMEQTTLYLLGLARGLDVPMLNGRYYFIDVNPQQDEQVSLADFFRSRSIDDDAGELPVIARFPYRAGVGNPFNVEICGTPGDDVELTAASDSGDVLYSFSGTLDETECHFEALTVDAPPDVYLWSLTVNGAAVNPRNTPTRGADGCGARAITTVEPDQPDPFSLYAFNHDMAFGLDEYSGQPDWCR